MIRLWSRKWIYLTSPMPCLLRVKIYWCCVSNTLFTSRDVVKRLVYSMIQFLQSQLEGGATDNGLTEEGVESVEVALQCLETAYGVSLSQSELASPNSLYQMFAEANKGQIVSCFDFMYSYGN